MSNYSFIDMMVYAGQLGKISRNHLGKLALITSSVSSLIFYLANRLAVEYGISYNSNGDLSLALSQLGTLLILALVLLWIYQSQKQTSVEERLRAPMTTKEIFRRALLQSIDAAIFGIAYGLYGVSIGTYLPISFIISCLMVLAGVYIGYYYGYQKESQIRQAFSIFLIAFILYLLNKVVF